MLASRLASCAATKASAARLSRAFAILMSISSGVSSPSTVAASALASAFRRYLRVHLRGSVDGRRQQGVRGQRAGVRLGGLQPQDGGVSARARRRALAALVSTSSGVILAAMSRECWSTTVLRP